MGKHGSGKIFVALDASEVLLSPDKNGNMPSHLAQGLKSTALREFLAGLESAAKFGTDSNRENLLHQSSSTGKKSDAQPNALFSTQLWGSMMMLGILLSAFLELELVRDSLTAIVLAVVSILFLLIRTARKPS